MPVSRSLKLAAALGGAVAALAAGANAYVLLSRRGDTSDDLSSLPVSETAIVLGAMVRRDGGMSRMLADRVQRGAELWSAGKAERILASGGVLRWGHDEADVMRRALLAAGVPDAAIVTDNGGSNTRASMVRASEIFGVREAIVVTQGFHMPRALFLASAAGIQARGLTADLHDWGLQGKRSAAREVLATVKALLAAAGRRARKSAAPRR